MLKPLGDAAVAQVIQNLLGSAGLPDSFIKRVVDAAEGNPLYVEQMLSMLVDTGAVTQVDGVWVAAKTDGEISIPPTIHALLEARLDKLERGERAAAEPASVIGLEFMRPAVQSLASPAERDTIDEKLQALSRKHFIRSSVGTEGDARFRFDHHMVRETVYNGLLKRARANMHAEYVKWSDQFHAGSDRGLEFEEILGYHLEQAYKYLAELGPIDEFGEAIGRDGARRLGSAGKRALARGDMHASVSLFRRASALLPEEDLQRLEMLPELGEALMGLGDFAGARAVLKEADALADKLGNERLKAASWVVGVFVSMYSREPGASLQEAAKRAAELIPMLERQNAHRELAAAWRLMILVHGIAGRYSQASEAAHHSIEHARKVDEQRLIAKAGGNLAVQSLLGSTPVLEAIQQCDQLLADGLTDRQIEGKILMKLAQLRAMNSELGEARKLYERGRTILRDMGLGVNSASAGIDVAFVELHGGDLAWAEREVRTDVEFLKSAGETYYLSTMMALLSRLVRDQGRDDEALEFSRQAEALTAEDDVDSQALWRSIRAPILARQGQQAEAEALAQSACDLVKDTEAPMLKADALWERATVLQIVGKATEAQQVAAEALSLFEVKGDVESATRLKAWMSTLS